MAANASVPEPALKLETERTPTETIIRCTGKITVETAPLLQETVRALIPGAKCIVVDLGHVAYIDSAGLGALMGLRSSARKKSAESGWVHKTRSMPREEFTREVGKGTGAFLLAPSLPCALAA